MGPAFFLGGGGGPCVRFLKVDREFLFLAPLLFSHFSFGTLSLWWWFVFGGGGGGGAQMQVSVTRVCVSVFFVFLARAGADTPPYRRRIDWLDDRLMKEKVHLYLDFSLGMYVLLSR